MTELIWEDKYKDGKKVAPVRIVLPFQVIETISESAADIQKRLNAYLTEQETGNWRNRLIWGDRKYVLPSLLPEYAGKVNMIYIDPPFNVGFDFSFKAPIADNSDNDENEEKFFVNLCKTASELTKENWNYIKVPQKEFEQLHPDNFSPPLQY